MCRALDTLRGSIRQFQRCQPPSLCSSENWLGLGGAAGAGRAPGWPCPQCSVSPSPPRPPRCTGGSLLATSVCSRPSCGFPWLPWLWPGIRDGDRESSSIAASQGPLGRGRGPSGAEAGGSRALGVKRRLGSTSQTIRTEKKMLINSGHVRTFFKRHHRQASHRLGKCV